jgi:hypothetical protein
MFPVSEFSELVLATRKPLPILTVHKKTQKRMTREVIGYHIILYLKTTELGRALISATQILRMLKINKYEFRLDPYYTFMLFDWKEKTYYRIELTFITNFI